MSQVERYWIDPSRLVQEGWHQDDTCVVKDWAYDRVVAERDALQQRLTAADERADVLEGLLRKAIPFTNDVAHDADVWMEINDALKPVEDVFVDPLKCCDVCGGKCQQPEENKTDPRLIDALREAGFLRND